MGRISKIIKTLDSIKNQTINPDIILLNIPKIDIPDIIRDYCTENDITINILDRDYGPATKLLGALKYNKIKDYDFIITIDDDHLYPPNMMKHYKYINSKVTGCTIGISG